VALTLTIAGTPKNIQLGTLQISLVANGRGRARFAVKSLDATYRPALDADVLIDDGVTRNFGGLVDIPTEKSATDDGSGVGIITDITAVDYNAYADRRLVSIAIQPGTLKDALLALEPYVTPYGIVLDAFQVNGPSLPLLGFTLKTFAQVLSELATLTADFGEPYVWEIDAFKILRMYQPSTVPAPFDVVGTSLPIPEVVGDIIVESKRGSTYANRFVVYMPPVSETNRVETFDGDGVTDTFTLQYTPTLFTQGYVTSDLVNETLGVTGDGAQWEYDAGTNTITRTVGPPASGTANISVMFNGAFSALAAAEDTGEIAAVGLWEKFLILDQIDAGTSAQDIADANLARSVFISKTVKYRTTQDAVLPGMSQLINVPRRNVNATGVISEVVIRDIGKGLLVRDVTVVIDGSQTNLNRGFRDVYKRWNAIGTGGVASSTVVGSGTVPGTGSGTSGHKHVFKTANETVTSATTGTTLHDDIHLFFPVPANARIWFEMRIFHGAPNSNADFKLKWTVPSGTTMLWGGNSGVGANFQPSNQATIPNHLVTESDTVVLGSTTFLTEPFGAIFVGLIKTSSTAGTMQLQWAQNTSDAGNSTFYVDSHIQYEVIG